MRHVYSLSKAPRAATWRHRGTSALLGAAAALALGACSHLPELPRAEPTPTWQPYPPPDRAYEHNSGDARSLYMHDVAYAGNDGETRSLSESRGKVVLLHYWASWCPECREEMLSLQRLADRMQRHDDLEIIVLNALESFDEGVAWARANGITLPMYRRVEQGEDAQLVVPVGSYRIDAVPRTLVIGREGIVVAKYDEPRMWENYDVSFETLLAYRYYRLPETYFGRAAIDADGADVTAYARPIHAQERRHELVVEIVPEGGRRLATEYGIRIEPRAAKDLAWRSRVPLNLTAEGEYFETPQSVTLEFEATDLRAIELDITYGLCTVGGQCEEQTHTLVLPRRTRNDA